MSRLSNIGSITVTGGVPSWVTTAISNGWGVGMWAAISGSSPSYGLSATNTLLSVNTAGDNVSTLDEAFLHSWTGAAFCSGHRAFGTYIMGPGGSHNNYGKGTVYLFDLNTRTWEEVAGQASGSIDQTFGEWPGGRPARNHDNYWPFYDSYRNEYCFPKGWGDPTSGSDQYPIAYGHGFDLDAYDSSGPSDSHWRRYPQLTGITGSGGVSPSGQYNGLAQQCGGAWDSSRNAFWMVAANNSDSSSGLVAKYDSAANTWTVYAQQYSVFLHAAYAIDPIRDVLVMPDGIFGVVRCLNLASPNTRYLAATGTSSLWTATNQGTVPGFGQIGWKWSTALNGFLYYSWGASTTVRLASYVSGGTFNAGSNTNYTLGWSTLTSGSNAVTPPSQVSGGAFSKFQLCRWGSQEVAIFYPRTDGAMYAFRVN